MSWGMSCQDAKLAEKKLLMGRSAELEALADLQSPGAGASRPIPTGTPRYDSFRLGGPHLTEFVLAPNRPWEYVLRQAFSTSAFSARDGRGASSMAHDGSSPMTERIGTLLVRHSISHSDEGCPPRWGVVLRKSRRPRNGSQCLAVVRSCATGEGRRGRTGPSQEAPTSRGGQGVTRARRRPVSVADERRHARAG